MPDYSNKLNLLVFIWTGKSERRTNKMKKNKENNFDYFPVAKSNVNWIPYIVEGLIFVGIGFLLYWGLLK